MSMINYASREINCKIVYYGPGLGGKTTNLEIVYGKVQPDTRGKLISLATETERTLFFDFLPVDLGTIRGFKTRFHLYTVPGPGLLQRQPEADPQGRGRHRVRRRLAARAHGSESGSDAEPVRQHGGVRLRSHEDAVRDPVQQTRPAERVADQGSAGRAESRVGSDRRRPRCASTPDPYHAGENLVEQLPTGEWIERAQYFEAVAVTGDGVFDTLKGVSKLVLKSLA